MEIWCNNIWENKQPYIFNWFDYNKVCKEIQNSKLNEKRELIEKLELYITTLSLNINLYRNSPKTQEQIKIIQKQISKTLELYNN